MALGDFGETVEAILVEVSRYYKDNEHLWGRVPKPSAESVSEHIETLSSGGPAIPTVKHIVRQIIDQMEVHASGNGAVEDGAG
jgi:hypothetical protein